MTLADVFCLNEDDGNGRGGKCPTCGVRTVEWRKRIISTAVASLVRLVNIYEWGPLHHDCFTVLKKDRNFSQLTIWGLVVPGHNPDGAKRSAGTWSPTAKGIAFARREILVPSHIVTWDNKFVRFDGEDIDVIEALNNRFSYENLILDNFGVG